jgi:hypothetical protein
MGLHGLLQGWLYLLPWYSILIAKHERRHHCAYTYVRIITDMKSTVFWVVTLCSQGKPQRFQISPPRLLVFNHESVNTSIHLDSKWFWRWCITHRITGFFGLFPSSGILENTTFRNWICFCPQAKVGEKTPTQLGPLERANLNHWTPLSDLHSYLIIWEITSIYIPVHFFIQCIHSPNHSFIHPYCHVILVFVTNNNWIWIRWIVLFDTHKS